MRTFNRFNLISISDKSPYSDLNTDVEVQWLPIAKMLYENNYLHAIQNNLIDGQSLFLSYIQTVIMRVNFDTFNFDFIQINFMLCGCTSAYFTISYCKKFWEIFTIITFGAALDLTMFVSCILTILVFVTIVVIMAAKSKLVIQHSAISCFFLIISKPTGKPYCIVISGSNYFGFDTMQDFSNCAITTHLPALYQVFNTMCAVIFMVVWIPCICA